MDSITAIFNIYFCDYGTVMTIISNSCFRQNTRLMKLLILHSLTWWIQGLSSTCPVFQYFQGLEFRGKKFKNFQRCVGTLLWPGQNLNVFFSSKSSEQATK